MPKEAQPALAKPAKEHAEPHPPIHLKDQLDKIRDGQLVGTVCEACGSMTISSRIRCGCGSTRLKEASFKPEGAIVSYTIQVVASETFINEVPFAWAIVQLDDGPKVTGWIPYISKPSELKVGQRVKFTPSYKPGMMFEKA